VAIDQRAVARRAADIQFRFARLFGDRGENGLDFEHVGKCGQAWRESGVRLDRKNSAPLAREDLGVFALVRANVEYPHPGLKELAIERPHARLVGGFLRFEDRLISIARRRIERRLHDGGLEHLPPHIGVAAKSLRFARAGSMQ
jgi:hypothetical protein